MPLIQVRDVPEHIYRLLAERAEKERRSLAKEAIAVWAKGLEVEVDAKARRRRIIEAILSDTQTSSQKRRPAARLIREDRRR
jgi:hypothetical protein